MVSQRTPISRALGEGHLALGGAPTHGVNVGQGERLLSLAGGGLLVLTGLRERGFVGCGLAALGGALVYRGLSGHCPLYAALGFNTQTHSPQASVAAGRGLKVVQAITVNASAEDLFNIWRDFENLPRFMRHLVRVRNRGKNRSRWVARGPAGAEIAWDAEIITEDPGRMIGWRSLEGSQVDTAGSVHFNVLPEGRGTEVLVTLKYDPPGGALGTWLAWLFGENPERQIRDDLRRFKQLVEAGEIAHAALRPMKRF